MQAQIPAILKTTDKGSIINNSSIASNTIKATLKYFAVYAATKAFVNTLTQVRQIPASIPRADLLTLLFFSSDLVHCCLDGPVEY